MNVWTASEVGLQHMDVAMVLFERTVAWLVVGQLFLYCPPSLVIDWFLTDAIGLQRCNSTKFAEQPLMYSRLSRCLSPPHCGSWTMC